MEACVLQFGLILDGLITFQVDVMQERYYSPAFHQDIQLPFSHERGTVSTLAVSWFSTGCLEMPVNFVRAQDRILLFKLLFKGFNFKVT